MKGADNMANGGGIPPGVTVEYISPDAVTVRVARRSP